MTKEAIEKNVLLDIFPSSFNWYLQCKGWQLQDARAVESSHPRAPLLHRAHGVGALPIYLLSILHILSISRYSFRFYL